jgi:23S rRNA (adenine-N6)-dimethyltransferase
MSRSLSTVHAGPHELGQNFLVDRRIVSRIVSLARRDPGSGPLVEWGPGEGALTIPLAELGRPLEAVEIDPRRAQALAHRLPDGVRVITGDILRHAPPEGSTVVSNVPFHVTTPVLRHLFGQPGWRRAVLLVQWEVARKRAGVGGATQMTAENWPWFGVDLDRRVPARAFRPMPSVDGGILTIVRRPEPLLPLGERKPYRRFVRAVFQGRGLGIDQILARADGGARTRQVRGIRHRLGVPDDALPRDLTAEQWIGLYRGLAG